MSGAGRRALIWITRAAFALNVAWDPPAVSGANWMYLGVAGVTPLLPQLDQDAHNNASSPTLSICHHLPGLVQKQVSVCDSHPNVITSVSDGAKLAIRECQYQFRNERWNCTTTNSHSEDPFGYIIKTGSKETAFIYAVTSAGVVHAITKSCSSGNLTDCSCDLSRQGMSTPEGWKWGGCSDNLNYGVQFAREFVDAPEREKGNKSKKEKFRSKMNLHNNEAGRETVAKLMRTQCRCHGVSGSCELKTCWRSIASFSEIGDHLKQKYDHAVQYEPPSRSKRKSRRGDGFLPERRQRRSRRRKKRWFPTEKDTLVHIDKSPNYCRSNPKKGIPGTHGRVCNKTSKGADSCSSLCCGRGYNAKVVRYAERCHCNFVWCCYVRCKTCITYVDVHTCK